MPLPETCQGGRISPAPGGTGENNTTKPRIEDTDKELSSNGGKVQMCLNILESLENIICTIL